MKRILSVFINRDNAIRIMVTALLAAIFPYKRKEKKTFDRMEQAGLSAHF